MNFLLHLSLQKISKKLWKCQITIAGKIFIKIIILDFHVPKMDYARNRKSNEVWIIVWIYGDILLKLDYLLQVRLPLNGSGMAPTRVLMCSASMGAEGFTLKLRDPEMLTDMVVNKTGKFLYYFSISKCYNKLFDTINRIIF